ncbi:MAG: protein BatD [Bacteroidetes bacterium]|nr:protein BatD [Bacteroidota bacterium]
MMRKLKYSLFLTGVLFIYVTGLSAQEVQFTAATKSEVAVGEFFSLTYRLNTQGSGFKGPDFKGFEVVNGPGQSSSTGIQTINGKTTMAVQYTFTYLLKPLREGSFVIGPASINVDGKSYSSNSVSVKVVTSLSQPSQNRSTPQGRNQPQSQEEGLSAQDVFLRAVPNNSTPYQGQGIIITFKLYTKVPIAQIITDKLSSFPGFWSQDLFKENEKFKQYNETMNGENYVVAEIKKVQIFPLKSGTLTIEPMEMTCLAQVRSKRRVQTGDPFFDNFFNDDFFGSSVKNVEKKLKSNALTIRVKSLPANGRPADFSGAVGSFTIKPEIDKTKLQANDAITYRITITGSGNIQLIDKLNTSFPTDFETYDPKVTSNINTSHTGVSGSKTFEYLLIPRNHGKFTIPPVQFSFFNLEKMQYLTLETPSYDIEVEKGTGSGQGYSYSGVEKEDIKYIGSDIRHIDTGLIRLQRTGHFFFGSYLFLSLLLIPLILFIAFIIIFRKELKKRSNKDLMRNRKATRIAIRRLQKAREHLNKKEDQPFFEEISRSLWGYLSDKYTIPMSELSIDNVKETLTGRNVGEDIVNQFVQALNNTEFARFAPGDQNMAMESIYEEALNIISRIERELK